MRPVLVRLGRAWKIALGYVGEYQARLLFTTLYFTLLAPIGFALSRFGDPLQVRRREDGSGWGRRPEEPASLARARRQF